MRSRNIIASVGKVIESYNPADFGGKWPYDEDDMKRMDETPDMYFYTQPRFVTHIDNGAIDSITNYYRDVLVPESDVLDICSSWISHLPEDVPLGKVVGVGMNAQELDANKRLTEFAQRDLNKEPTLPFADESFDACLNVVSVDYLCKPEEIFAEMHRVLRPGGQAICSFSNRCFPTKAVQVWLAAGDAGRRRIVGSYFACSPPGGWTDITALDITGAGAPPMKLGDNPFQLAIQKLKASVGDPMFVVRATKV